MCRFNLKGMGVEYICILLSPILVWGSGELERTSLINLQQEKDKQNAIHKFFWTYQKSEVLG